MTQVTALVLRAVAAGPRYGCDVMETCVLPSGTAYPALRRLEKAGLLGAVPPAPPAEAGEAMRAVDPRLPMINPRTVLGIRFARR